MPGLVAIAHSLSDTSAGIRPADVPLLVEVQIVGALAAAVLLRWLVPNLAAYSPTDGEVIRRS